MHRIKYIDLFCGIGSFHHSLSLLGWECVFACDIDENCRQTYKKNHGMEPSSDICAVDVAKIPKFDVLCGGFPCQPFSAAGHRQGFEDARGNMFLQIMRFVEHHQPEVVLLENVLGLLNHDGGKTMTIIISTLEQAGYHVRTKILLCSDYGIPQMRKRIFIVATKAEFPESLLNFRTVGSPTLTDFLNCGRPKSQHMTFTRKNVAYTIRCGGKHSTIDRTHNWDGYWVKKTAKSAEVVYRLTVNDCLKLQGFDENSFHLVGTVKSHWKMVGNTIPTNFTRMMGEAVDVFLRMTCATDPKHPSGNSVDEIALKMGHVCKKIKCEEEK